MPGTINHQLVATTPDNTTAEIRPSHWNAGHAVTFNAVGSEISGALSNSNNVSFGLAPGGAVTASFAQSNQQMVAYAAGNTTQGSSGTFDARSLSIQGVGGVSVGVSGGSLVVSGSVAGPGTVNFSAGTTFNNLASVVFSNANNVSFGLAGSTITGSAAAQTVQTAGLYGVGNTTGASSSTVDARSVSFSGAGAVSVGLSGGAVVISAVVPAAQSNQTLGLYASSQTTGQSSSSTVDARSLTLVGQGVVSVGMSGGSLVVAATTVAQSVQTQNLHNVSLSGNTAGVMAQVSSGTLTLAGGNNITLSQAGNAITISGANAGGAQTGISGLQVSNTTYTSGTVTFQNANGISFGSSGANGISASYTVPTQSNQTVGLYGLGNTTQNSSTTLDARSLSFNGLGELTVGFSNGSIQLSVPAQSIGVSTGGNTSGNTGIYSGQVVFAGGNNITLSVSSAAGGAQSITISGANAGGAQTGISALVVSNTTYTSGTVTFQNANGISFGSSGANGISASYTVPTVPALSVGVSTGGNTSGNTGIYSGQLVLAGGNNITLSVSSAAGGAQSITISGANAGGAQTGISGLVVSNTTYTSGTVTFQNANGISFGSSGANGVSASYTVPSIAGLISAVNFSAGTTSGNLGSVVFSNSNGVSFGLNGSTITGSVAAQTAQTVGIYGSSQTTGQSSSSTVDARSISFVGQGIISVGLSGGSVLLSATTVAQSNQTEGRYAIGNTTGQSSSSTFDARTLSISGAGGISVGYSGNALVLSSPSVGSFQSAGVSNVGNTAGNTGLVASQLILAGGNNITVSQGTAAGGVATVTISAANQSNQSIGIYGSSQTTGQSSSSTVDARSITFVGAGVVSVGMSGGSVIISSPASTTLTLQSVGISTVGNTAGNTGMTLQQLILAGGNNITLSGSTNGSSMTVTVSAAAQSNQTEGRYALGNTTGQSSSSTFDARTLSISGAGGVSVGYSANALVISGAAGGAGSVNFSAGTTSGNLGSVVFSNSNGVSFGLNGSTITGSVAAQTNQTVGLYGVGNTTQNSSTTLDARSISFDGLGAMTVGFSNGSVQLSAPATSSLVGVAGISVSVNGSTISISVVPQLSSFNALGPIWSSSLSQVGQGSVQVYPLYDPEPFIASRADILASVSVSSSSNSSHAGVVSAFIGVYTRNGSTLSLASSASQSYQWTNTSNNSMGSVSGFRRLSVPLAITYNGGDAWVAVMSLTSSTNANWFTASNVLAAPAMTAQLQGLIGEASNNTKQLMLGSGVFSVTSAGLPSSMAFSALTGQGSAGAANNLYMSPVMFANVTA